MATLKETTASFVQSSVLTSSGSDGNVIQAGLFDSEARYLRSAQAVYSSAGFGVDTSWSYRTELSTLLSGFKANSLIQLSYYIPARNDSTGWGGLYIEPQIEFNQDGSWFSLGCSGYDGSVMIYGQETIASYMNVLLIDPGQTSDFSVKFRFAMRSYNSTTDIDTRHDINTVSGTASIMSGINGRQHYSHILVEEYALWN